MEDYVFSKLSDSELEELIEAERRFQKKGEREIILLACEPSKPKQL